MILVIKSLICSIVCIVDLGHIKLDQTLTKYDDLDHISTGSLIFFRKLLMLLQLQKYYLVSNFACVFFIFQMLISFCRFLQVLSQCFIFACRHFFLVSIIKQITLLRINHMNNDGIIISQLKLMLYIFLIHGSDKSSFLSKVNMILYNYQFCQLSSHIAWKQSIPKQLMLMSMM